MNDTQRHTSHFYDVHFFTLKHFDTLLAFFFFFSILFYTLQRSECRRDEQQNGEQTKPLQIDIDPKSPAYQEFSELDVLCLTFLRLNKCLGS